MRLYSVITTLLIISSLACRTSKPPGITICLGNGLGGATCKDPMGVVTHKSPSELENYWMLSPTDSLNFSKWCYDTSLDAATKGLNLMNEEIKRNELASH